MTPNPRDVATLANEIMELEDRLSSLRQRWETLFNGSSPEQPKPIGRPPRENSAASQVQAAIDADPESHWDAESLARQLDLEREIVATALYNLFAAKKIARHSRGRYQSLMSNPYAAQIDMQIRREQMEAQPV